MNIRIFGAALLIVAFLRTEPSTAQPGPDLLPSIEAVGVEAGGKDKTQPPDKDKQPPDKDKKTPEKKSPETKQPQTDAFTQTPDSNNQSNASSFNPHMMGDFGILFARQRFTILGTQTRTRTTKFFDMTLVNQIGPTITNTTTTTVAQTQTLLVPYASSAAAFKVAENESPRPTNRVFGVYNYFGGIRGADNGTSSTFVPGTKQLTSAGPLPRFDTVDTTTVFTAPRVNANLHREVFGFEKTFLDGFASVEVRLPFLQTTSNIDGFGGQNVGDVTIVTKYAFLLDNTTGNVFSAGLAITAPTGPGVDTVDGNLHSTLLQPWFGYIRNFDGFFIQGFHSIVAPTDPRDVTLMFTDIGINYWLYRGTPDQFLNYIVPLAEVHVTTPLNHRNGDGPIVVPDQVVFTGGAHFGIMRNTSLSLGVATPLTGPRPFTVEGFAQLNWRY